MATGNRWGRDPVPIVPGMVPVLDPVGALRDPDALQRMAAMPGITLGLPHQAPEPESRTQAETAGPAGGEPVPLKPKRPRAPKPVEARPVKPQEKRIVFAFSRDADVVVVNLKDARGDIEHAIRVPFDTARAMLPVLERLAKIEDLTGELTT